MAQSVCVGKSSDAQLCPAQELANELMLTTLASSKRGVWS